MSRCTGSFQTVSTDVAGAKWERMGNPSQLKVRVPCPVCGKLVGLRSRLARSRGVLALHQPPAPVVAVDIETWKPGHKVPAIVIAMQQKGVSRIMEKLTRNAAALGATIVHDSFTLPGTEQEQMAKMDLACSTSGLFFGKKNADKVFHMKIQDILGAFLSAHGQHALAAEAFASTARLEWEKLVDDCIRTAPEAERTHVAHTVKLALDDPANGGPGSAQDFEIREEARRTPMVLGHLAIGDGAPPMYRAYMIAKLGGATDAGLASDDIEKLKRRIVGLYVAREIKVVK